MAFQNAARFFVDSLKRRMLKHAFQSVKRAVTTSTNAAKEKVDCVVIGAGVVGIAIARELALKGREVLVLDSAPTFGTGTSSRNSEVIHAGIYYPHNSLKVCQIPIHL